MPIVLITGGAGGIGREISVCFARHGYDVAIQYNAGKERAESLSTEISARFQVKAASFQADFAVESSISKLFDEVVSEFGAPDVLVNNAGISEQRLFTDVSHQEWQKMLNVNLSSAFYLSQCVAPYMIKKQKGAIVNISSMWGVAGASCEVAYSAAKAGMIGFTKALAKEVAGGSVRVNCVAPGCVSSRMTAHFTEQEVADICKQIPLGRFGDALEIAESILFIAEQSYTTGQVFSPNGGMVI